MAKVKQEPTKPLDGNGKMSIRSVIIAIIMMMIMMTIIIIDKNSLPVRNLIEK